MHTHFSRFSLTTEMDSLLVVPVSFRTWFDFDVNEAIDSYDSIDIHDFITQMFYCLRKMKLLTVTILLTFMIL